MAKSRMLARSISIDKELNELSLKSQLIYTWCIPFLDDFGLITNDVGNLKYLVFPRNPQIEERDIDCFLAEATKLIEILDDCLFFKGFIKNNTITEYKKAKSEFQENGYNKGKSKYSPEIPSNPPENAAEDKISKDKISKDKIIEDNKKKESSRFAPPSLSELNFYIKEANLSVNGEQFIDFYTSKGWKIGSSPMKDWKASARNWARRDKKPNKAVKPINTNLSKYDNI